MAVCFRPAMSRKVLPAGTHATRAEPRNEAARIALNLRGRFPERAVSDHLRASVVDVEYGRKAEVDPHGAKFRGEDESRLREEPRRTGTEPQEVPHGRNFGKAFTKALHAPAFMINRDQNAGTDRMNGARKRSQLLRRGIVSREENHRARERMLKAPDLMGAERRAFNIDHDGTERARAFELFKCEHSLTPRRFCRGVRCSGARSRQSRTGAPQP